MRDPKSKPNHSLDDLPRRHAGPNQGLGLLAAAAPDQRNLWATTRVFLFKKKEKKSLVHIVTCACVCAWMERSAMLLEKQGIRSEVACLCLVSETQRKH
ncbi:hypothetical protein SLA2020_479540 [Shorea laevis]